MKERQWKSVSQLPNEFMYKVDREGKRWMFNSQSLLRQQRTGRSGVLSNGSRNDAVLIVVTIQV